ncbi:MepB family protein [Pedobacter sp. AW31-3R]|uniref:MepB family protein n=1 Tax=Pedobacter sp. AW31-3R TaxID=3445781 RepID=UPI003F9FAD89
MTSAKDLNLLNFFPEELKTSIELVYHKCGFKLTDPVFDTESKAYAACSFVLNGKLIHHRKSKITPTKTGQFVTIWKRNAQGITTPFDFSDHFDFIVITACGGQEVGQFIFPKAVLAEKAIISSNGREGKRGIRVYPPWDKAESQQAAKTIAWQTRYFISMGAHAPVDLEWIKKIFI